MSEKMREVAEKLEDEDPRQKVFIRFGNEVRRCHVINNTIQDSIEFTVGFYGSDCHHYSRYITDRRDIVYPR